MKLCHKKSQSNKKCLNVTKVVKLWDSMFREEFKNFPRNMRIEIFCTE